uniref:Uncharacterized protein n=1 Tax=Rhizophora mucronata TaxID=61149 RepID=A0A2P2NLZ3_RHIMU
MFVNYGVCSCHVEDHLSGQDDPDQIYNSALILVCRD